MAFAGGVYTLPAGNPVVTNTTIESSWANTTLSDIATALSTCVLKDGTQTITANLPMSGFKLTGLAAGTAATDSARFGQLQANLYTYLTGTTGTNTITASATPTLTSLTAGLAFRFIPANTNTGAVTLQVDSTAATNVFSNGSALLGNELKQNVPVEVFYDGTQYQIIGSAALISANAVVDNTFRINAAGDQTKRFAVSVTGVTAGATVTMVVPGTGATFVGDTLIQTLTNKTLTSPTITSPTINTLVTGSAIATQAQMSGATSLNTIVTPGNLKYAGGLAQAWGYIIPPTTVASSFPSTGVSVVKNAVGDFTVTHGGGILNPTYSTQITVFDSAKILMGTVRAQVTGSFQVVIASVSSVGALNDPDNSFMYVINGLHS